MSIEPAKERWPEMYSVALDMADEVCRRVNQHAFHVETAVGLDYKPQCCLEMIIEILQARV